MITLANDFMSDNVVGVWSGSERGAMPFSLFFGRPFWFLWGFSVVEFRLSSGDSLDLPPLICVFLPCLG